MKIAILISALYKYHYYHYYHFYIPSAELVALAIAGCVQDGQPDGHYYWSTYLCSGWRQDPSQCSSCWGFVFLLFQSPCLVGFRFFRFMGLSMFTFTKCRFAFCSPPVTVKVLFVPVNSILGGSIASLCSNYVSSARSKIVQPLGFCLGHCH